MNFGIFTLNQNIKTKQNYVTWILIALLFILKYDVEKWFDISNYDEHDKRPL